MNTKKSTLEIGRREILTATAGAIALPFVSTSARAADVRGRNILLVDATETSTGSSVSLETSYNGALTPGEIENDIVFTGVTQFASGADLPVDVVLARAYVNDFAIEAIKGRSNAYFLLAGGQPQPANAPQEFTITSQRKIEDSPFVRVTGQVFDPKADKRVNFTVTHDPEPTITVIVGVVAGLALLICGAVVLTDLILEKVYSTAKEQCGERGAASVKAIRTYGFAYRKGGIEVGCGTRYEVVCNKE